MHGCRVQSANANTISYVSQFVTMEVDLVNLMLELVSWAAAQTLGVLIAIGESINKQRYIVTDNVHTYL